ncbi:MAG: hypothetical protein US30_C0002G0029 [Candidatus Moranbacteria bacterium GW2011_GWF2_36_839]|nr:MAG: hypothetical protein US27_C0003G0029 [Candidatus Moranbacteria bacterium GW2011_GWF1_36_78]KKQ17569.1 MAG: hypothetical protein US30_C0002G0029 [Candidatus Moranbacteria bacterium GW2011_GWF2_36_839]HAT74294.1 hypothetical protein [Candidatus Moranbacteria bacterium]HBY10927.1 hypothetical protein [Candidatus Moranbacteria bacterium]
MKGVTSFDSIRLVTHAVWLTLDDLDQLTDKEIIDYGDALGATVGQGDNKMILVQIKEKSQRFLYVWELRDSLYDYFLKNS